MPLRPLPLAALVAVLLAGCSGAKEPPGDLVRADALPAGSCRRATGPVNAVHRSVADLQADAGRAAAARQPLSTASRDLEAAAAAGGAGAVPARLADLVQAVGFLRLGIDTHSYDTALLTRTDAAAQRLVDACRAG